MNINQTKLENGLNIITENVSNVETVTIGVWIDVGTRNENKEINGISHMLEHMAFKGTRKRSSKEIAEAIENIGGEINAYTSMEFTAYYVRVLKEYIPIAIDILSDIIQNSIFPHDEITKEKSVIIQEINQINDNPEELIFDVAQEVAFLNQSLGLPTLGTKKSVLSLTRENIICFMKNHYYTSNIVLSASGNLSHKNFVDTIINSEFNTSYKQNNFKKRENYSHYCNGLKHISKDLEQVHLILGFSGISFYNPDYYSMLILNSIIGTGMASKLFQKVREDHGLAYNIYSYTQNYRDNGIINIFAGTSVDFVQDLLLLVIRELKNLRSSITEEDLIRAKALIKSSMFIGLEDTFTRCRRLAVQFLIHERIIPLNEILMRINLISKKQIIDLSEKIFSKDPILVSIGKDYSIENIYNSFMLN